MVWSKTVCTVKTVNLHNVAPMCNTIHMHKQPTWVDTRNTVNTHDANLVPKTICMVYICAN